MNQVTHTAIVNFIWGTRLIADMVNALDDEETEAEA